MHVLRIEHPVPSYEAWKAAFDSDPVGRARMGVRRHQVLRPADDAGSVTILLEFDTQQEAEALLSAMQGVWSRVAGTLVLDPDARVFEVMETREY